MNTNEPAAHPNSGRAEHIAVLIGQYPNISHDEIQEIKDWWNREASALDVAMMSGRPEIATAYRLFRQEQIDPLPSALRNVWVIVTGVILVALALYFLL